MKKTFTFILILVMLVSHASLNGSAVYENDCVCEVIHINENFYIVITVEEDNSYARTTNTKSGTKTISCYDGDEKVWDATVRGTFSYTGSSSTCTIASITYNIYNDNWKMTSATATKSSNKAIGDVTVKRYFLGITTKTVTDTITLTCSADGTLS